MTKFKEAVKYLNRNLKRIETQLDWQLPSWGPPQNLLLLFRFLFFLWANKLNAAHSTARSHSQFNKLKVFVLWPTSRLSRTRSRSRVGVGVRVLEVPAKAAAAGETKGPTRRADG